jgi:hypothetical protein
MQPWKPGAPNGRARRASAAVDARPELDGSGATCRPRGRVLETLFAAVSTLCGGAAAS